MGTEIPRHPLTRRAVLGAFMAGVLGSLYLIENPNTP